MNTQIQKSRPTTKRAGAVPMAFTVGLFIFSFLLSIAGYAFRLLFGEEWGVVLRHAALVVPSFVIGIPFVFWIGSLLLNKLTGSHIHPRNALTLGWLISTVAILSIMGVYS